MCCMLEKQLRMLNCLLLLESGCIWRQQNIILENKSGVLYLHYGKAVSSVGFQYIHNLHEKEEYLHEREGNCKAAVMWQYKSFVSVAGNWVTSESLKLALPSKRKGVNISYEFSTQYMVFVLLKVFQMLSL